MKSTVSRVFEDLNKKFQKSTSKIEVFLSTLRQRTGQRQENFNFGPKTELTKVGIFCTQFPSLGNFINTKVGNRKN